MAAESSQTLDRGLRVLRLLADADAPMTVTELADRAGLSRPVVYRLLAALETHGLLRRDGEGRCRLGLGVLALARQVQPLLRDTALGPLRRLAEAAGATSHLTIADGGQALALAVVEPSWTHYHVAYRVGARHELAAGAAGRAILAGRVPAAATDFVVSASELQLGAHGVAAPLRGVPGVEASVGVVALVRLDAGQVGPAVVATAAELAAALR